MHIRSTLRSLIRTPSFSLAVVLTLALGVGATSAMFGVVSITRTLGVASLDLAKLFSGPSGAWSDQGSIVGPILAAGSPGPSSMAGWRRT